jgi:predicted site-specific integrase-resolvase
MIPADPTPSLDTQLLTEERVAWIWGVAPRTVRAWREAGELSCIKKGKNLVRYQAGDVLADLLGHYRRSRVVTAAGNTNGEDLHWQRIERLIETAVESRLAKRLETA